MAETLKPAAGGIDTDRLKKIAQEYESHKEEMDSARGSIGEMLKTAEDAHGLHRPAFKVAMQLKSMEPTKAQEKYRRLEEYLHKLGVFDQWDMIDGVPGQPASSPETASPDFHAMGKGAALAGTERDDHDFEEDSDEAAAWQDGWDVGKKERKAQAKAAKTAKNGGSEAGASVH